MSGKTILSFKDRSSEPSSMSVWVPEINNLNFDAQELLRDALQAAVNGISLGLQCKLEFGNVEQLAPSGSSSATGQRELKLAVNYHDNVTFETFVTEVPVIDEAITLVGSDSVDPANALWIAFVAAFEAYALSPYPRGNAVTIDGGQIVGRTL